MFLLMCVVLFTGGVGFPACITGHMTRGVSIQGGLHPGVWADLPWDTTGYGQRAGGTRHTG